MKKLCYYKILQSAEAYKLGQLAESEFRNVAYINEIAQKEGDPRRYVLELVGGTFYAKEMYCQAVARYEIKEE